MIQRSTINRGAALGRLLFVSLLLVACGGRRPASEQPAACPSPPPGIGPNAKGTLQNADDNKHYCVHVGDVLTIFLRVPLSEINRGWGPIQASGSVLEPMSSGVMTLVRGVRGAVFKASAVGTAVLQSTRSCSGCSPSKWSATITVK